jgi:hypothetical protein
MLMAVRNLTERVEVLEMKAELLEEVPARLSAVESQIVHLRTEMRGEFSAVRQEMGELGTGLRQEMSELRTGLGQEIRGLETDLRQDMRALNDETKAEMRVLHEEVLDRISRINEGTRPPRKRKR